MDVGLVTHVKPVNLLSGTSACSIEHAGQSPFIAGSSKLGLSYRY